MRTATRSLILLLALLSLGAEIKIAKRHQLKNRKPGYCMWLSLQMMGRHLGYAKLHDIAWKHLDERKGATATDVEEELDRLGIAYTSTRRADIGFLRTAIEQDCPVQVGFKTDSALGPHSGVVTDVTRTHVIFVDPNDPGETYRYEIADFAEAWDGWGLILKESK